MRVLDIAAGHVRFGIAVAKPLLKAEAVGQDFVAVLAVAHASWEET